jgi:RNA polymerase primary sigma factor
MREIAEEGDRVVRSYFADIAGSRPLSREREVLLAASIKEGDMQARDELVQANLRFVVGVAKNYQNRGLSLSDLISAGNLGLLTAAERFDGTKGYKFISYAVWWIRQSILQTIRLYAK